MAFMFANPKGTVRRIGRRPHTSTAVRVDHSVDRSVDSTMDLPVDLSVDLSVDRSRFRTVDFKGSVNRIWPDPDRVQDGRRICQR